jgi:peptidoglycan lytic transglycosylase A
VAGTGGAGRAVASAVLAVALAGPVGLVTQLLAASSSARAEMTTRSTTPKVILQQATFADLPGWKADDHLAALKTFLVSCEKVTKSAERIKGRSPQSELARTCRAAQAITLPTKAAAKEFFEENFVPHRVEHKGEPGFLTGYYEPVLEGSRKREGRFQTPVYKRPPDLVNVVKETERARGGFTHLHKTAAGLKPYATRAEIEKGALKGKGLELIYLADAVDTFFMHIQGSGRIKLPDGSYTRLNYDGKNGHPYTSIGRYLIKHKLFPADRMSLGALGKWLRADTARGQEVMWQNESFVFFRELKGRDAAGPRGAMGVVLTPGRSLAVDTAFHVLGTPIYVSAPKLKYGAAQGSFRRLMVAQDVGSAIKGPERGDIYFGSGKRAGQLAGKTSHQGSYFVLLPASVGDMALRDAARIRDRRSWLKIEKAAR